MVKVTYKPWEEIIVHEAIQHSIDDLVKLLSVGVPPGGLGHPILWSDGVAFTHDAMPPTNEVIKEQMQGRVHWSSVRCASMLEYKDNILIKETNVRIPVLNVSNNPILKTAAEWMKTTLASDSRKGE